MSDLVDVKVNGATLEFTAKSSGSSSKIEFGGTDVTNLGVSATASATGDPSTVERAGLEAGTSLTAAGVTLAVGSTVKFTVGSDSEVTIDLNKGTTPKTYDTSNADANVAKAAMDSLIKDINASLQSTGMDSKITASLSKDNKIQFISETGKDITLGTSPVAGIGLSNAGTIGNVQQVVGAGAQGVGFSTKFQIG
ncbi:flagellin, partial [Clostridioides difficile]